METLVQHPVDNHYSSSNPLPKSLQRTHFTKKFMQQNTVIRSSFATLFSQRRGLKLRKKAVSPVAVLMDHRSIVESMSSEISLASPSSSSLGHENRIKSVEAEAEMAVELKMTALVTVRSCKKADYWEIMHHLLDGYTNTKQKGLVLQLASTDIHPRRMQPKLSSEATLEWCNGFFKTNANLVTYKVEFTVDSTFGMPGAILVGNRYRKEIFLESVDIDGVVHFSCNSWVQPLNADADKRIFFTNKAYLPWDTPLGLKHLREMDLHQLRGDGDGVRKLSDRVYDYDVYNDLGNPDKGIEFVRPILGGERRPYPRRCRTGRPPNGTDKSTESPASDQSIPMYVPRDEGFEDSKWKTVNEGTFKARLNNLIPTLTSVLSDTNSIKEFSEISCLYKKMVDSGAKSEIESNNNHLLPLINLSKIRESIEEILKFDPPKTISRVGSSFWLRDDEFGRLALAGMNPLSIERLTVFPPVSKLDPSLYGQSALKEEHIIGNLNGMSVQQALEENKLFILDYHDIYLPFLDRINALGDRNSYATRTIFFLTPLGTLKPVAIELSLPLSSSNYPSKQVVTPPFDATSNWLWQLAKAHVSSNDAGVHQLVHHWLRSHACMEPFIIATNRQLSKMHPLHKLLHPHLRYTLEINAKAREYLINAGGIIELFFSPGRYSMEISASAYQNWWRFDSEALPADLIRRGMATPDPTQPGGVKLVIEDYPYAADGLFTWSAIETLVRTYVNHYYSDANQILSDMELQAWYRECIKEGHADHRHANWWPKLSTPADLIIILTTIIWIVSAQHAATNFGQYAFGAFVPIRPPMMRRLMPRENDPEYDIFLKDPEKYYLSSLPTLPYATHYMSILHILSTHAEDEEYLGVRKELSTWSGEPEIIEAFYKFSTELKRIEMKIQQRNSDPNLRNRCGAGISPYELLMSSSEPGISCRGVPNSVSI